MTTQQTLQKIRITYIDIAKGILIMLVLYDHLPDVYEYVLQGQNEIIHTIDQSQWVYKCFFMPAFFVITGMCSSFNKPFRQFLISNFKSLIIPNVVFTLVGAIPQVGLSTFKMILLYFGEYWFLTSLFVSKVICYFINKYISGTLLKIIILLTLVAVGFMASSVVPSKYNILYWYYSFSLSIFIYIGQCLRQIKDQDRFRLISRIGGGCPKTLKQQPCDI